MGEEAPFIGLGGNENGRAQKEVNKKLLALCIPLSSINVFFSFAFAQIRGIHLLLPSVFQASSSSTDTHCFFAGGGLPLGPDRGLLDQGEHLLALGPDRQQGGAEEGIRGQGLHQDTEGDILALDHGKIFMQGYIFILSVLFLLYCLSLCVCVCGGEEKIEPFY